jgi:hypothetical protein
MGLGAGAGGMGAGVGPVHCEGFVTSCEVEHGFMTLPSAWHALSLGHQRQAEPGSHEPLEAHVKQSENELQFGELSTGAADVARKAK